MLILDRMNWKISYYNEKVRKQVFAMPAGIVADYVRLTDAMTLYGADLRMPHSRPMGGGLFELRPKGPEGIGRVFYCTQVGRSIVMLHSFVKKTQETPDAELRLARKRLKDVQHG
jgi:phage-related protein